jgi:hypothetical protein
MASTTTTKPKRESARTIGHTFYPRHLRMLNALASKKTRGNASGYLQEAIETAARRAGVYEPGPHDEPKT